MASRLFCKGVSRGRRQRLDRDLADFEFAAFALQGEGGEFEARKVTIEPLPPATTNTPSK